MLRPLIAMMFIVCALGCAKEEEEVEGTLLPDGGSDCVSSEAEPTSNDGFLKIKVGGDYSGELTYTCYKIPTLIDGDADLEQTNSYHPDLGVVFNNNGAAGAYNDIVHFSFSFSRGFYEGLSTFQICPFGETNETQGGGGMLMKIRTPKLENPETTATTYDVWLQDRCDGDTVWKIIVDSHDTATNKVTGHFDELSLRTDDMTKKISVSGSFSFVYSE
ncbi:MAG: hypothetical protein R3B45_01230 [Bdellovibrionota bacterium]